MTAATAPRFAAVRLAGRYRVQETATGWIASVCASKAKAEAKAAALNALETPDLPAEVANTVVDTLAAMDAAPLSRRSTERRFTAAERDAAMEAKLDAARDAALAPQRAALAAGAEGFADLPTTPEEFTAEVTDLLSGVPVVKHRTPKALREPKPAAEVGPMARLDPVAAAKSRPAVGRATVAAVSPAAAKGVTRRKDGAVVLASGLVEGSPEANAAEAAEDARITAMQEVAANKADHRARLTANQKAGKARVAAARAAEAVYAEDQPAIVAERAAADATARVRVGLRLAEAVQAATALTLGDSLRGKLSAKAPNGDGVRVVHLTATERAALGQVCNNVEATAREAVAAGDRAAVSLVFSAQATLRQLAAV